jgi:hypothetical protein
MMTFPMERAEKELGPHLLFQNENLTDRKE